MAWWKIAQEVAVVGKRTRRDKIQFEIQRCAHLDMAMIHLLVAVLVFGITPSAYCQTSDAEALIAAPCYSSSGSNYVQLMKAQRWTIDGSALAYIYRTSTSVSLERLLRLMC